MKRDFARLLALLSLSMLPVCCKPISRSSQAKGYYEGGSALIERELNQIKGKLQPIPEYEPTKAVILGSALFTDNNYINKKTIIKILFEQGVDKVMVIANSAEKSLLSSHLKEDLSTYKNKLLILDAPSDELQTGAWARDWSPISARPSQEGTRTHYLLDFNYGNEKQQGLNDSSINLIAQALAGNQSLDTKIVHFPVYFEGGSFMVNSEGQCIIGILTEDLYREKPSDAPNFKKLSASETREYFRDYVGCKELLELAPLPKEGTGHVDLFAKFISNKEIILNRIYDEDLALLKKDDPRLPHLLNVKNHLEDVKATLLARDFQVIDVPLPILNNEMENVFYSFTNSLIVNTAGRKRIIVPQYSTPETPALPTQTGGDSLKKYIAATSVFEKFKTLENTGLYKQNKIQDYLKKKELQTAEVLKMHGFDEVIFIPSLDLIRHGGSLHCVTMEVPAI